jgi:hypothetical protein
MFKYRHMEKLKRSIRHIKLISMNSRLFWMHLEVQEVVQGAVHVPHDHYVPHVCHTLIRAPTAIARQGFHGLSYNLNTTF